MGRLGRVAESRQERLGQRERTADVEDLVFQEVDPRREARRWRRWAMPMQLVVTADSTTATATARTSAG
jgi:hypothetical protein